ncbi:serine/threonine-protein kinase [Micromonospora auratinigra]|uniref:Serine/threonine protein kinase n=1 Tax=Micromonospora auratinigra TaxID=261654 RepID=A0A1A8ZIM4_9ACTN|nr:serine/threonine-protein kinase [Micromonospora auratinigra]SBT43720.1 Serine/threonine protein kinase [Micromonospora auratinigra]
MGEPTSGAVVEPGAPLRPGDPQQVGPYLLRRRLGSGGMGVVFLARAPGGGPVAVKVVHHELRARPEFRRLFAREVAAASRVADFCTARVLDADPDGPVPYLVTEYVDGLSLHDHVARHGSLSGPQAEALAVGVAAGLTAIHSAGLAHGDLTPRNVLLSPFGPKVIDFGLASLIHTLDLTAGPSYGTPGWLAPERLAGRPPAQPADVWAWGILVAWAATGRLPVDPRSGAAGVPDLRALPAGLAAVVARALHADPRRRPTAREAMLVLVGSADTASIRSAMGPVTTTTVAREATRWYDGGQPATLVDAPPRPRPRRSWPTVLAWVVTLVAVSALAVVALRRTDDGAPVNAAPHRPAPSSAPASPSPSSSPSPSPRPAPARPSGQDGSLAFTVRDVRCGTREIGMWPLTHKAEGVYCMVDVDVTNKGAKTAIVWVPSQQLVDTNGRGYTPDARALLYHPDTQRLTRGIKPGATVSGSLVYDTPVGTDFRQLVVHDSPLSAGTTIELP